jgi:thiosulfate reductase cytochrome b subunit
VRDHELRDVLAVRAIEKADRDGAMLPPADRAAASREARRASSENASPESLLVTRSRLLLPKVAARHSFVTTLLEAATGPSAVGWLLVALAALVGFGMSVVDDHRRINVLVPVGVLAVIGWNLLVYLLLLVQAVRGGALPGLATWFTRFSSARLMKKAAGAVAFNAPLAEAMGQFAREWFDAAHTLLLARASRVFHLAAAAAGITLIAGIYLRGLVLDYYAGWESTFLDAPAVRSLLALAYGPASFVTGIAIPDVNGVQAMRWVNGIGGTPAAPWLHLIAASILLVVVLPRVVLALAATARVSRLSRSLSAPPGVANDFRNAFGTAGGLVGDSVEALAYAYEPEPQSRAGLRALLGLVFGPGISVDWRSAVRYGEEDDFIARLAAARQPDVCALVFNLASTPEVENHGALLAGVRDWIARKEGRAKVLVIVDEAPYAARMTEGARPTERREAWRQFVSSHGLEACCVDLTSADFTKHAESARESLWPRT